MSPHHATPDEARRTTLPWAVNYLGSRRVATRDVRDLEERWIGVPPGATLRLSWAAGARLLHLERREARDRPMTRASPAQNVPFGHGHPAELPHPITAPNGG